MLSDIEVTKQALDDFKKIQEYMLLTKSRSKQELNNKQIRAQVYHI